MDVFSVMKLLGGLGLFLYGMSIMGSALEQFAGGKLEKLLAKVTSNPVKGVILGAVVTAIIQSSSATTVMAVGFVNSGIMNLTQAIGIIIGSNTGTTITAWILSLAGLESSNAFIQLLQPKNFSLIFCAVGAFLYVFKKDEKKRNIGAILIGFTILIYGMDFMSAAVSPLKSDPNFQQLLILFTNPIAGVLLGTIVTAVIQSSSASVGILQALSVTGAVTYSSAIPIILGQNIGTCVTAMISAIGAKREARRVAFVHLYFNVLGSVVFLVLVYAMQAIIGFGFWNDSVTAVDIAVVHTVFNVFCTLVFLPFTKVFAKLAIMTVPDKEEDHTMLEGVSLDPRFLNSPGFAIEQCKNTISNLCTMIEGSVELSKKAIISYEDNQVEEMLDVEQNVNRITDMLNSYLVEVTRRPLTTLESRYISKLFHSVRNLERVTDSAKQMVMTAERIHMKQISLSDSAKKELTSLFVALQDLCKTGLYACAKDDTQAAQEIYPLIHTVHVACRDFREGHIERVKQGECTTLSGMYFDDILLSAEQMAERIRALLVQTIAQENENYRSQEYLESGNIDNTVTFKKYYREYKKKYFNNFQK